MQEHSIARGTTTSLNDVNDVPAHWSRNRRDFLRILGSGAALAALGPLAACSSGHAASRSDELRNQLLADERFWADVAGMFTLDPARRFLNVGTAGSMPKVALDMFDSENRTKARESGNGYSNLLAERTQVAPGFGVDGRTRLFGEHLVRHVPRHPGPGLAAGRIGNNQTAALYATLFDSRIRELRTQGKRVRAMMFSAPSYKTGTMLPIAELMEIAKLHGLVSIVDGAHLPGMMAYDYAQLGMDFMSGAGHKWQCGPGSTGILIVRNKIRASNPLPLPNWYPIHTSSWTPRARSTGGTATWDIAATITACGSLHTPMFHALVASCALWDQVGRKKIETYDLALSAYLKERITEIWGVERLYSPKDDPKLVSAVTSFNPFINPADAMNSAKSGEFVARMLSDYSPGFVIRNVNFPVIGAASDHYAIRISTHLWTGVEDIDRLVGAMADLAGKMG